MLEEKRNDTSQEIAVQIEEACQDLDGEVTATGSNMDLSALGGSGISIKVFGEEIDTLKEAANEIAEIVADTEGTEEVSMESMIQFQNFVSLLIKKKQWSQD